MKYLKTAWKRRGTLWGSRLGATAATHRFGVTWSLAGAPGLGIPPSRGEGAKRLCSGSSLGRQADKQAGTGRQPRSRALPPPSRSLLLAVKKVGFLPKTTPSWDEQCLLLLPGTSETLSLSSVLRLGFSGLFLALGSFASSISTASLIFFSNPSLLRCPRLPVPSAERPPHGPAATAAP